MNEKMIIRIRAINDAEFAIELWKSVPSYEHYVSIKFPDAKVFGFRRKELMLALMALEGKQD
ncbi:MAG: hypothetical protein ACYC9R_13105 [Nitrosotalea sp.]